MHPRPDAPHSCVVMIAPCGSVSHAGSRLHSAHLVHRSLHPEIRDGKVSAATALSRPAHGAGLMSFARDARQVADGPAATPEKPRYERVMADLPHEDSQVVRIPHAILVEGLRRKPCCADVRSQCQHATPM